MKKYLVIAIAGAMTLSLFSCANTKRGCASTSATMGAERVLSGEKPEKKSKFKIKGMN